MSGVRLNNPALRAATGVVAASAPAALLAILVVLVVWAWPAIRFSGVGFITTSNWSIGNLYGTHLQLSNGVSAPAGAAYGAQAVIVGTLLTTGIAMGFALPVALALTLALVHYLPRGVAAFLYLLLRWLAGMPSVIYGFWGLTVVIPWVTRHAGPWVSEWMRGVPYLAGPVRSGYGLLTSALVLAVMMVPTVVTIARDVVAALPGRLADEGRGLGMTEWEVFRRVEWPQARNGLMAALVLGMGRVVGEAVVVLMVSGNALTALPENIYGPVGTMAGTIMVLLDSALTDWTGMAVHSLAELALALFAVTLAANLSVPWVLRAVAALESREGLTLIAAQRGGER